jgi:hypothetical protein
MHICYLGFPDLKVGNELPTYRRGIWLFRRGLDSFCSLNNSGVESFAYPAWKLELSRSLFVAGANSLRIAALPPQRIFSSQFLS